jgi:hypothetical protein
VSTQLTEAFDLALEELGFDLDDNSDDILTGTVESDEEPEAEDGPEGDESGSEDSEAAPDDGGEAFDGPVIDVPSNGKLRLPDGTEVEVEKAVLLQADYTRKTQELAEHRKQFENEQQQFAKDQQEVLQTYEQMRGWYEERSANPTAWVQEIVESTQDPTATIAKALYELAQTGRLDPAFVETFGIDGGEVAERAKAQTPNELAEIKARLDQRDALEQQRAAYEAQQLAVQHQVARYQSQWDTIKQSRGLQFETPDAEVEAKRELLQFALESKLTRSLEDAFDLMSVRRGGAVTPKPVPTGDPEVTAKKRASRAVARKGVGSSGGGVPKKGMSTREAALAALDEFATGA